MEIHFHIPLFVFWILAVVTAVPVLFLTYIGVMHTWVFRNGIWRG